MLKLTRAAALVWCVSLSAAARPVQAQSADEAAKALPEGQGKSLVATLCVGCHTLDVALEKRGTADEWRATVKSMIDLGARITTQDASAIASYLGQHFGPTAPARGAAVAQSATRALPDGPGKEILMKKCFQCHQVGMWSPLRLDRRGWEAVLYRMVGRGALWTEDEINAMADYLARVAGPPAVRR